jgi:hypothetical protein
MTRNPKSKIQNRKWIALRPLLFAISCFARPPGRSSHRAKFLGSDIWLPALPPRLILAARFGKGFAI